MNIFSRFSVISALLLGSLAQAQLIGLPGAGGPDTELSSACATHNYGLEVKICVSTTKDSHNPDILYFFHGAMGNERAWTEGQNSDMRREVRMHWQAAGFEAPTVVVISFGNTWLLQERDGSLGLVVGQIIPDIERSLFPTGLQGQRLLMGVSMGGFNALQLMLRHPEMWNRAAIIAPLMPACNSYDSQLKISLCLALYPFKKNPFYAYLAHVLVRESFPEESDWESHELLTLGKENLGHSLPPFLLTSGEKDDFAFFEKNKAFAGLAMEKGAPILWLPTLFKHGVFDTKAMADYLSQK
jgi:pimeloyl-ACP methyl ester carboxylesterase